ncbi:MAG TPA: hypothetical protein VIF10_02755 [Methylobacter sp.]|jgi:hypothetical protein
MNNRVKTLRVTINILSTLSHIEFKIEFEALHPLFGIAKALPI